MPECGWWVVASYNGTPCEAVGPWSLREGAVACLRACRLLSKRRGEATWGLSDSTPRPGVRRVAAQQWRRCFLAAVDASKSRTKRESV